MVVINSTNRCIRSNAEFATYTNFCILVLQNYKGIVRTWGVSVIRKRLYTLYDLSVWCSGIWLWYFVRSHIPYIQLPMFAHRVCNHWQSTYIFLYHLIFLSSSFVYTIDPYLLMILYVEVSLLPNHETCFTSTKKKQRFLSSAIWYGENFCQMASRVNKNRYWYEDIYYLLDSIHFNMPTVLIKNALCFTSHIFSNTGSIYFIASWPEAELLP